MKKNAKEKENYDIYGEPEIHPRVGKEYQAEIPILMSKSQYLDSLKTHPKHSLEIQDLVISGQNKGSSENATCLDSEKTHDSIRRSQRQKQLSSKALEAIAYQSDEEKEINKLKHKRYPRRSKQS